MPNPHDPNDEGHAEKYRNGNPCATPGCQNIAGTAYSRWYCPSCTRARIKKLDDELIALGRKPNYQDSR